MRIKPTSLFISLFLGLSLCDKASDKVTSLPNVDPTLIKSEMFSGYYTVSNTRKLHYLYIKSMGNPETDPVVLFMMGGPGTSSILQGFTNFGPFISLDGTSNFDSFETYTWCRRANLVLLDNPAGVGYSHAARELDLI